MSCSRDTNGDGDCGRPLCPECRPAPRVVRRGHPGAVYVGRPSKWGNPFRLPPGPESPEKRREVIDRYRRWLVEQPALLAALPELRGRDLACYCAPLPCHADVLLELANMLDLVGAAAAPGAVPSVRIIRCHCPPGAWPCECG